MTASNVVAFASMASVGLWEVWEEVFVDESVWVGVASLRDYQSIFPSWPRLELSKFAAGLEDSGLDLLDKCLKYAPNQRISAKQALDHAYFDDLDKDVI